MITMIKKKIMVITAILTLFLIGSAIAQESEDFALPSPPEAALKDTQNFRLGGADIIASLYSSSLGQADVIRYYQDFFAQNQFKLISDKQHKQQKLIIFQKGNFVASLSLETKGSGTEVGVASYLLPAGVSSLEDIKPAFSEVIALLPKQDQPGDDLAFIPRPPKSVRLPSVPVNDTTVYLTYKSSLPVNQTREFYKNKMPAAGWEMESEIAMDEELSSYEQAAKTNVGARPIFSDLTLKELISGGTILHFKGEHGIAEISLVNVKSSEKEQGSFIQIRYVKGSK